MRKFGIVSAFIAFAFCFAGGFVILKVIGFDFSRDDVVWTGLALYFIGKAVFVGSMLILNSHQS